MFLRSMESQISIKGYWNIKGCVQVIEQVIERTITEKKSNWGAWKVKVKQGSVKGKTSRGMVGSDFRWGKTQTLFCKTVCVTTTI